MYAIDWPGDEMSEVDKIFKCTRCGYCCHGETTVSLDEEDQKRMCAALKLEESEVEKKYWRRTGNVVQMKIVDGHCVFYQEGCTVHGGRPWRCGEWPLHPSILHDENNFLTIRESCPGIIRQVSYTEFCAVLKKIMAESAQVKC